ncbi:PrgI family protein [Candidatus Saccharibacteria bacterium]|nr:PrgI family protein [Candidatus Saccharibacteria bacterium]
MAQYKVPQDVEADDKLLGPFTFRQFVYLMIMGGMIALAVALFQIFPFLALLPLPIAIFFAVLALPLKKDQPMETYLAAIVSYHLRPRNRFWNPGQRESTIQITAPKVIEQPRTRNITGEEASTRLSFLANVVDTEGNSLRTSVPAQPMQPAFYTENISTPDVLEPKRPDQLTQIMTNNQNSQRTEIINQMRASFAAQSNPGTAGYIPQPAQTTTPAAPARTATPAPMPAPAPTPVQTTVPILPAPAEPAAPAESAIPMGTPRPAPEEQPEVVLPTPEELAAIEPLKSDVVITPDLVAMKRAAENKARLAELAKNKEFSVATIAKQANRINKDDEVYISLH